MSRQDSRVVAALDQAGDQLQPVRQAGVRIAG